MPPRKPPRSPSRLSHPIPRTARTPLEMYAQHVSDWKDCKRCVLHEGRQVVVFARGAVPCDVLFVGEGPGESEDTLGQPFVGPAGFIMDQIITSALGDRHTYALTNLVACIPRDGVKSDKPPDESIEACTPRLLEFVRIADPRLIVCVGALARDWLTPGYKWSIQLPRPVPLVDIIHPAAILKVSLAHRGLMVQRCVVTVANAVEMLQ